MRFAAVGQVAGYRAWAATVQYELFPQRGHEAPGVLPTHHASADFYSGSNMACCGAISCTMLRLTMRGRLAASHMVLVARFRAAELALRTGAQRGSTSLAFRAGIISASKPAREPDDATTPVASLAAVAAASVKEGEKGWI
jgi:hypothetical protein